MHMHCLMCLGCIGICRHTKDASCLTYASASVQKFVVCYLICTQQSVPGQNFRGLHKCLPIVPAKAADSVNRCC